MSGGMILAAMASNGQVSPSIDHFIPIRRNRQCIEPSGLRSLGEYADIR
jgi:hypothetical protein